MIIKQFEDKNLAHYSYAILSGHEMAIIDPSRDPQDYYDFAAQHQAKITAVIETHPHADFVSSHLEIQQHTGATIYVSKLLGAEYEHAGFDEGDAIVLGKISLKALNTPGHSPDSISIVAYDEQGKEHALFSGDTLFIGDCGRPDLREQAGAITAAREILAKQMYHSLRTKLMVLPDTVLIYPAHGAGSLCGKELSKLGVSSLGEEKLTNWSLQEQSEANFVTELLSDQPFIPKYFTYDVALNKKGAAPFAESISNIQIKLQISAEEFIKTYDPAVLVIDSRPQDQFKQAHLKNAYNLMNDSKFETWLGSIVFPEEPFYLIASNEQELNTLIARIAKIGYEHQIALAFTLESGNTNFKFFDSNALQKNEDAYTIIDIRNPGEVKSKPIFEHAMHIPLYELRERTNEIPLHKPILVHCAGGFRSAVGSSIIRSLIPAQTEVYDLSTAVKNFQS
ncbi:MAG: MBL fold metallo-hydrolase [Saprospiraceae bacterium]